MKRVFKFLFIFVFVFLLAGCKGGKVVTKCTLVSDQSASNYTLKSEYNVISNKDKVYRVETVEVVESKNNTILAYFEDQLKKQYKSYNDTYKGYKYDVVNKDGKVIAKVTIDYTKMDLDKFVKDNPAMKSYVDKDNNITLSGIKTMYESMGAKCSK